jgi:hypothetical protein
MFLRKNVRKYLRQTLQLQAEIITLPLIFTVLIWYPWPRNVSKKSTKILSNFLWSVLGKGVILIFFNFRNPVGNFPIWNQSERDWNFAANFWTHQKQKQKLTKYNEREWNKSIVLLDVMKFCKSHWLFSSYLLELKHPLPLKDAVRSYGNTKPGY